MASKALLLNTSALSCLALFVVGHVEKGSAEAVFVHNHNNLPKYNQHHDYREQFKDSPTDILKNQQRLTYSMLPDNTFVNSAFFGDFIAEPRLHFPEAAYYSGIPGKGYNLAGGSMHCTPTSAAMWMKWYKTEGLNGLKDLGEEINAINFFAKSMDTNDLNELISQDDWTGHFGTRLGDATKALDQYFIKSYNRRAGRPKQASWDYLPKNYKRLIDNNKPVLFWYRGTRQIGHTVVGVGYSLPGNDLGGLSVIANDPWDGEQKPKPNREIIKNPQRGTIEVAGFDLDLATPTVSFDDIWYNPIMQVVDVPDSGDAPSIYLFEKPALAQSGDREWLGATVTGEIDPFSAVDDPDGLANVNDNDYGDDGIHFTDLDPIDGYGSLVATISSLDGMRLHEDLENDLDPTLYLSGWVDWNRDTIWDDLERIMHFALPADFDGSYLHHETFPIPLGSSGKYWSRFRLSRGELVGPYGNARFGEIEDYEIEMVPAPLPILSVGILLGYTRKLRRMSKYLNSIR